MMRIPASRLFLVCALAVLPTSLPLAAGTAFEGTAVFKTTIDGVSRNCIVRSRGAKVRIDFDLQDKPMAAICNNVDTSLTLLLLTDKMAVTLPHIPKRTPAASFAATGAHRDMLGMPADEYEGTVNDSVHVTAWVTTQLGSYFVMRNPSAIEEESAWEIWARTHGLFPLAVVESVRGRETRRVETLSVTREEVADDTFAVPQGFHTINAASTR